MVEYDNLLLIKVVPLREDTEYESDVKAADTIAVNLMELQILMEFEPNFKSMLI
jgi:hypothetical protein